MKKIMFNDKYGLTQAVLEGRKTMTRRIVPQSVVDYYTNEAEDPAMIDAARFEVGEVVAIAQAYEELANDGYLKDMTVETDKGIGFDFKPEYRGAGWNNKMFVRADLMPHHIRITDIKVERLQDISREDMSKEGIVHDEAKDRFVCGDIVEFFQRDAFAAIIDKISGKGTWARNPWVFCYEFELIK